MPSNSNSLQHVFQYFTTTFSVNNLLNKQKNKDEVETFYNNINRSYSDMTISSFNSVESNYFDDEEETEPWKLNESIQYRNKQHDYFFMDRDELLFTTASVERDSYGFKRPTQWVKLVHLHQFDIYYQPILNKQQASWDSMLNQFQCWPSKNSPTLINCVREGIPSSLRGKVWMHYSGAKERMEKNPDLYRSLVNTALLLGDNNEYAEIIKRDLHRTFPDNSKFACQLNKDIMPISIDDDSKLASLQRLLLAFSIYSPQIGYCQSLNYLVGLFLLFLENEEEAFWMLVTTVHDFMPENMYDVTMEGARIEQWVLLMFIKEKLPLVWENIKPNDDQISLHSTLPPLTLVTSPWFLTLFINILPIETVLRIWDCFFVEGYSIMFQVALTIIQMNQEKISDMQDPIEIFQILQNMPKRLIDCHQFMNYVFSSDLIDMNEIHAKREHIKNL